MRTWQMAGRNIFRARRRSLVTIFAMAFALAIMMMYVGLMNGLLDNMEHTATAMEMGQIQVHHTEYRDKPSIYKKIENSDKLVKEIEALGLNASYRMFANGLAAHKNHSAGAVFRGLDPDLEKKTTELYKHMAKGEWLDKKDPKGVLLGRGLAKSLAADIGDEIVVVSQATDGSIANDLYKVRGILKNVGDIIDRSAILMCASAFRELMVMNSGAHQIVVSGEKNMDLDLFVGKIKKLSPESEVLSWKKINPALADILVNSRAFMVPTIVIVYLAIAMVILNAMLMAVFERIKEYGIMRAIGVTPIGIFMLVIAEAFILTVWATIMGTAVGLPLTMYLASTGLDISSVVGGGSISGIAIDPVWRATLNFDAVFQPISVLFVLAVLATIYPALKAALLKPIEAMRHN